MTLEQFEAALIKLLTEAVLAGLAIDDICEIAENALSSGSWADDQHS